MAIHQFGTTCMFVGSGYCPHAPSSLRYTSWVHIPLILPSNTNGVNIIIPRVCTTIISLQHSYGFYTTSVQTISSEYDPFPVQVYTASYGGREGPFHSANLSISQLDVSNLSISNLNISNLDTICHSPVHD